MDKISKREYKTLIAQRKNIQILIKRAKEALFTKINDYATTQKGFIEAKNAVGGLELTIALIEMQSDNEGYQENIGTIQTQTLKPKEVQHLISKLKIFMEAHNLNEQRLKLQHKINLYESDPE